MPRTRRDSSSSRRHPALRPTLDCLEARRLLATFLVTNENDVGAGSLRAAVALANTTTGADTISFQANVRVVVLTSGQLTLTDTTGPTTITGGTAGVTIGRNTGLGATSFRIFEVSS